MRVAGVKLLAFERACAGVAQGDAAVVGARIHLCEAGEPSSIRLGEQARCALALLAAALPSARDDPAQVERQVAALARQIDRMGANARDLERDLERMRHCAYHDPLTGLPNRRLLLDRLDRALAQAGRRHGQVALLMIDVDDFKRVNDGFGHEAGDRLLQSLAERLQGATRDADTVSRYGGDEFVILIPEADGREGAATVARKIRSAFAAPFVVHGRAIMASASIGVAVYPEDGVAPSHLLQCADAAMYADKGDPARDPPRGDALVTFVML